MAGINMSYYIYMPAQLEKIQNEPDYRRPANKTTLRKTP